ncbi:outer-membrane lipoprotein carrier protein LolA [Phenylobacterium sp.]|uniref:LolA family protein n=1 Tax=Phenylobacterium sp. TaxID=1871053 RepID=UPI0025EEEE92|nr:outer-membrane lipoprotein carrier protein LolA [Phenylobacterium sp.]MBX3482929.1 outer-membrane lipoprotein carrier protein LolA [Phenylobacterium sp.]MCW5759170.1 outer-membrane lipoprotein carrier protein LolA [Phenylobacterium sp.]
MTFTRRSLALALAATSFAGGATAQTALSAADQALVDRAIAYLEGLNEARGRFIQTDARGRATTGQLFMKRPGKARFAYDAPSGLLVVSDGGVVSVQDKRLKTFDAYPLGATPLSLFLAKSIRLDKGVRVTRVQRLQNGFSVTARDGKKETAGEITLSFTDAPLALAGWTVTDAQGRPTRVQLQGLERASGLDKSLFVLKDPRPKNPGRGKV